MLTKTRALVLHTVKYGESQLIVDLLTEACGRLSFILRLPRTPKARVRKQFFQPLSLLELEFDHRPSARLQRLREVRLAVPFVSIPFEERKLAVALFVAEFVYYCTRDEQANSPLFCYIEASLRWLDGAEQGFSNFHLVFMMRLSRFIGFYPNLEGASAAAFFDLRNAVFTPSAPLHGDFLRPEEASRIVTLMRMNYETMHLFRLSRTERNRITQLLLDYYRLHVPQFPELRSLPVVQELFV